MNNHYSSRYQLYRAMWEKRLAKGNKKLSPIEHEPDPAKRSSKSAIAFNTEGRENA